MEHSKNTWGHLTLASFAGTSSANSAPSLKYIFFCFIEIISERTIS